MQRRLDVVAVEVVQHVVVGAGLELLLQVHVHDARVVVRSEGGVVPVVWVVVIRSL